jgi:hypothetical protein
MTKAAVTGSASVSGTVTAGDSAACGFAADPVHLRYKAFSILENSLFSGMLFIFGLKKPFFWPFVRRRLLGIDCCALSSETASFKYGV